MNPKESCGSHPRQKSSMLLRDSKYLEDNAVNQRISKWIEDQEVQSQASPWTNAEIQPSANIEKDKSSLFAPLDEIGKPKGSKNIEKPDVAIDSPISPSPQRYGTFPTCWEPHAHKETEVTQQAQNMPPQSQRYSLPASRTGIGGNVQARSPVEPPNSLAMPMNATSREIADRDIYLISSATARPKMHRATKSLPSNQSRAISDIYYPSRLETLERRKENADFPFQRSENPYPEEEELRTIREDIAERTLRAEQDSIRDSTQEKRRLSKTERVSRVKHPVEARTIRAELSDTLVLALWGA